MQRQYAVAINLYKQVVTMYKNTSYASVSVSRIFSCAEKKFSTQSEYQALRNYLTQLRTSNHIPETIRELAEDFIIKTRVRCNQFSEAITNYEQMYQQNQTNNKGLHARLNKLSLISMRSDTGDNTSNLYTNLTQHKHTLLGMMNGFAYAYNPELNTSTPNEYKLYQNYPNPFNPSTKIRFSTPLNPPFIKGGTVRSTGGFITLKIYDILGREVATLVNDKLKPGTYEAEWDGTNYPSGIYFYQLSTDGFRESKKMILMK